MNWRVIMTDTESATGVAPVCENRDPDLHEGDKGPSAGMYVYDCCPYPQIETWDERVAERLAQTLTEADASMAGA